MRLLIVSKEKKKKEKRKKETRKAVATGVENKTMIATKRDEEGPAPRPGPTRYKASGVGDR